MRSTFPFHRIKIKMALRPFSTKPLNYFEMLVYSYLILKNLYGVFLGSVRMQHGSSSAVSTPEVFRGIPLHHRDPELTLRWTTAHFQPDYCKQDSVICNRNVVLQRHDGPIRPKHVEKEKRIV
jgi:hypothetical protein